MRREDDGLALSLEAEELLLEELGVDGVESAEGLVHDEELGVVEQCADDLHLLLHPLGELIDALVPPVGPLEPSEELAGSSLGLATTHPLESSQVDDLLPDLHLGVEPTLLGEVADTAEILLLQ